MSQEAQAKLLAMARKVMFEDGSESIAKGLIDSPDKADAVGATAARVYGGIEEMAKNQGKQIPVEVARPVITGIVQDLSEMAVTVGAYTPESQEDLNGFMGTSLLATGRDYWTNRSAK